MISSTPIDQSVVLPIRGMTCLGCAANVELALRALPGVEDVTVDFPAKQATVMFDPTLTDSEYMAAAITEVGYRVADTPAVPLEKSDTSEQGSLWRKPLLFGFLGMTGLILLYLGLVSLAEGWEHAVKLLLEDAWIVGPIMLGFGVQMGLYGYLRGIQATIRGAGALAGAGGGTSTVAMAACCAHHVTDVLPLLGLSAGAAFLAEYRISFMVFGLVTNLIGIAVMAILIVRAKRHIDECSLAIQPASATCH
ncbi:MAG: cation transporter [Anaerolineae bacterium]|nr:cation transporter [Anaerolineae bacterium]